MRFDDKGRAVRRLQEALIARGHTLDRHGADGHLGAETWDALAELSRDELGQWAPRVPSDVIALLRTPAPPPPPAPAPLDGPPLALVRDLRGETPEPDPRCRIRDGRTVRRALASVTGITLHQTATPFGVSARQVKAAGGDAKLAKARRALGVACHVIAFADPEVGVVWARDLRAYVNHAGPLNRSTIGIEIEARLPGLQAAPTATTWGGPPTELTDELIQAGREAMRLVVTEARALGMVNLRTVYAHRQSSATRRADPGEQIWREIVTAYGVPVLGLETKPAATLGSGRPIPREWQADGVGAY